MASASLGTVNLYFIESKDMMKMRTLKTRTQPGLKYYLKSNPEVARVMRRAVKYAKETSDNQIVYEDEPGSVAYVREGMYGAWEYQTEDKIIAKIVVYYE